MGGATSRPQGRELDVGDRIHIRHGKGPLPALVGRIGTVVDIFRVPLDACLVRIDGDPDRREWFFYSDEIATGEA